MPALFKQASKFGRKPIHIGIMIVSFTISFLFLLNMKSLITGSIQLNFFTWLMAGGIFGLDLIVPGLSASNFLVYLNMYKPMTDAIKTLDFSVIIPIAIGGLVTVISLSKLMKYIFDKAFTSLSHVILGLVLASTVIIIPIKVNYLTLHTYIYIIDCIFGIVLGLFMSNLEERYKH